LIASRQGPHHQTVKASRIEKIQALYKKMVFADRLIEEILSPADELE